MRYLVSVITVVMCLWSAQASAKHIIGGDLLYTHITGNTYKITLTLYGDCYNKGSFNLLPGSSPLISISRNGTLVDKVILPNVSGDGTDVSPVCPSERNNTTCNNGTLPGIFKFVYEANVSLTAGPGNWSFVFRGTLVNSQAGRSDNITNIYSPGTSFMQLTATLDNTLGDNSSPQYSTLATGYSCINVLQQYNQGASDPDGDSLGFALVPAIDSATSSSVNYVPPYTATNPIATAPGDFAFNTLNGQLNFTPNAVQKSLVVYQVSEYRGGRLVGTSEREMTFIVRDDCTDAPPAPYVNNLTGGSLQKGNVIELCQGGGPVSFAVNFNNAARDTIILTPGDVPTGATLNITGNNTTSPQANCFLNTSTLPAGSYSFHLSIKNIHCPISSQQSVAYTVHIVPTPSVVVTQLTPTRCVGKAALRYDLINGFNPRTVSVFAGGTFIKAFLDTTGNDSSGVVFDSLTAGNYTLSVSSDSLCLASASFTIVDSGTLPLNPYAYSVCQADSVFGINILPLITGASLQYYGADGTTASGAPVVNAATAGTYTWYIVEQFKSCISDKVPIKVVVHPRPEVTITNIPESICYGDQVYLTATGAQTYKWQPADVVKYDTAAYLLVYANEQVEVTGTDAYGCTDTASAVYDNIIKCCRLSYPNAFTPNNDSHNDGWKIITYGNMERFDLKVFDRWGKLVFASTDPHQRWDGTFQGMPCEIGSYFFVVDAKCITGPKRFLKGDFTLIR